MGAHHPYMYESGRRDWQLPEKEFDPKAVTRASWEVKPKKPKKNGPLLSFNRHPDSHVVPTGRSYNFRPMSGTTKWLIKWTRHIQLALRVLELVAGAGLLTLMILISNVAPLTAWILRIAPGVIILCSAYAIMHLARPARARPPGSSAAYQVFASLTDLAIIPFYAFGAINLVNQSEQWETIVENETLLPAFIKSEYYTLLAGAGMHTVSLGISIYLALMFRRIANMPPDMNPLESNLTSRVARHKRNKSSMASSTYTCSSSENMKRLSTPLEDHRRSGAPYEALSRPPSIPFMHTRSGSRDSLSSKRDSRGDLPSRQYQITPGNSSPRSSVVSSAAEQPQKKRMSNPRLAQRGSYMEVPLHETPTSPSRPDSSSSNTKAAAAAAAMNIQPINASPTRIAKFTEAWYASESLINRTQQRQQQQQGANMSPAERAAIERSRAYEALSQRYGDSDSESELGSDDRENASSRRRSRIGADSDYSEDDEDDGPINVLGNISIHHPNPLRLNPLQPKKTPVQIRESPHLVAPRQSVLGELSMSRRNVSGSHSHENSSNSSQDIADAKFAPSSTVTVTAAAPNPVPARRPTILGGVWGRAKGNNGNSGSGNGKRMSSIQTDGDFFYSKPYGELKSRTPPLMYGGEEEYRRSQNLDLDRHTSNLNSNLNSTLNLNLGQDRTRDRDQGRRQVSSGNDYDVAGTATAGGYRRKVSGRAAEEGMAGPTPTAIAGGTTRYSRYSALNE